MHAFSQISTERLCIVPFQKAHISTDYISWLNDKALMQFSEQRHRLHTRETCEAYVSSFEGTQNLFLAVENLGGELIGTMTAYQDLNNGLVDMGIMVGAKMAKGKGYGNEAWQALAAWVEQNLKPRKLTAGCMASNASMLKLMKVIGMQPDGVRKNHYLQKGRPVDIIYMAKMIGE